MGGAKKRFLIFPAVITTGMIIYGIMSSCMPTDHVASPKRPNILFVTLDTTRVDHLSCYGYNRETTPNTDRVAEEGHKFIRAVSTSSWTLPAHASIFTGTYPSRHGARFAPKDAMANAPLHVNRLDDQFPTLAEILNENGYATAGIGGGPWFHQRFGLGRGFTFYDDPAIEGGAQWMSRTAKEVNEIAIDWLRNNRKHPFFLFINYFDPHTPYTAPKPFSEKFGAPQGITDAFDVATKLMTAGEKLTDAELESLLLAYDNEIAYADHFLGKLLEEMKALDVYDSSIIIITSDHGEYFGEHDLLTHSVMVYEEVARIPLIIRFPESLDEEMPVDNYVQLTDLMPTILNKLAIPVPSNVQGGVIGNLEHPIIVESFQHFDYTKMYGNRFDNDWRALYRDNFKYIWTQNSDPQLFDLSTDPHEQSDIIENSLAQMEVSQNMMKEWLSSFPPYPFELYEEFKPNMRAEELERLKALGYIQ